MYEYTSIYLSDKFQVHVCVLKKECFIQILWNVIKN